VNNILRDSYQTNSEVIISSNSDQSVMITKLPPMNVDKEIWEDISLNEYILKKRHLINDLFSKNTDDIELIVNGFEKDDYAYLQSKQVHFHCPCSKDRFVLGIKGLNASLDEVFHDDESVEVKCDYCGKPYTITKEEVLKFNS
jgi:molecular chaperone Hsp33